MGNVGSRVCGESPVPWGCYTVQGIWQGLGHIYSENIALVWGYSSEVEHLIGDQEVSGSSPDALSLANM